jgi:hypothetical protein
MRRPEGTDGHEGNVRGTEDTCPKPPRRGEKKQKTAPSSLSRLEDRMQPAINKRKRSEASVSSLLLLSPFPPPITAQDEARHQALLLRSARSSAPCAFPGQILTAFPSSWSVWRHGVQRLSTTRCIASSRLSSPPASSSGQGLRMGRRRPALMRRRRQS